MGSKSDGGQAALIGQMVQAGKDASAKFEGLEKKMPTREEQELALAYPELFLSSADERINKSALEDLSLDSKLQQNLDMTLEQLGERSREGLTAEDRARREEIRRQSLGDEQARQSSILASMAARGAGGSGAELAARLASSQNSAQNEQQASLALAADTDRARREALMQQGQFAQQMSEQDLNTKKTQGNARDQINQFNAAVASRDTEARRQQAGQKADTQNFQQQYNKELAQREFENLFNVKQAQANALTGQAGQLATAASMVKPKGSGLAAGLSGAASGAAMGALMGGTKAGPTGAMIGAGIGGGAGILSADDGGVKYADGGANYNCGGSKYAFGSDQETFRQADDRKYINDKQEIERQAQLEQEAFKHGVIGSGQVSQADFDAARATSPKEEKGMSSADLSSGLGALSGILKQPEAPEQKMIAPPSSLGQVNAALGKTLQYTPRFNNYADGGYDKMGYEEGGSQTEGRLVPGDNFAGDEIPDRINSKEAVLNVSMQQKLEDLLREVQKYRVDKMLEQGQLKVNSAPQEEIMNVLRGDTPLEKADFTKNVVEVNDKPEMRMLEKMLKGR